MVFPLDRPRPVVASLGNFSHHSLWMIKDSVMQTPGFTHPRLLLVGDGSSTEMQEFCELLQREMRKVELRRIRDLEDVFRLIRDENWYPDLGLVLQNHPDEFSASLVHRILGFLPLTRWLCCYGHWCEANGRTRKIWPEAVRVPLWEACERIQQELISLRIGEPLSPPTASLEETLIRTWDLQCDSRVSSAQSVEVVSSDIPFQAMLKDFLREQGWGIFDEESSVSPEIRLWDVDPLLPQTLKAIDEYHLTSPHTQLIAFMHQPYPEDYHRLVVRGCRKVIPKLSSHHRLIQVLEEVSHAGQRAA